MGVPGVEGEGDGTATSWDWFRVADSVGVSPGAGLPDIRLAGNSIRVDRLYCDKVNCPSRVLRAQMCTDLSLL